jgi:sterol desaturase/sphingolipid hydroxylase (fatty acid hydroxylase superfamily)
MVGRLPFWAQLILFLFLADLIQYWSHWVLHVWKPLWHVHAVHHSPMKLDWLVAARVHPIELAVNKAVSAVPLYLVGFGPEVVGVAVPLAAAYSLLIHSNLRWTYGPLGYVVASPAFHHWHHASDPPARDKNFAQTFSIIDYLFGTAYFPRRAIPEQYGLVSGVMPDGIWRQFLHPLRQWWQMIQPAAPPPPDSVSEAMPKSFGKMPLTLPPPSPRE